MIGISIHRDEITYLQSNRKEDDLSILAHGSIKYKSYDKIIPNVVNDVVRREDVNKKDNMISFVIDSDLCFFNEVFCEDDKNLDFHKNLSGNSNVFDYMDSYYYPINNRDDNYLGIHLNKNIKSGLISSVEASQYSLRSIGLGLFSAEMMARNIFGAHSLDNYLIVRFISSSVLELLYINDGILMVYGKYKISGSSVRLVKIIGSKKDAENIVSFLNHLIKASRISTKNFNKIFIYQSAGQSPIVKKIMAKKSKNVTLLNLFDYDFSNKSNKTNSRIFTDLKFADHGDLFRGLNV